MVAGSALAAVATKMMMTFGGGSSSVFKDMFDA